MDKTTSRKLILLSAKLFLWLTCVTPLCASFHVYFAHFWQTIIKGREGKKEKESIYTKEGGRKRCENGKKEGKKESPCLRIPRPAEIFNTNKQIALRAGTEHKHTGVLIPAAFATDSIVCPLTFATPGAHLTTTASVPITCPEGIIGPGFRHSLHQLIL